MENPPSSIVDGPRGIAGCTGAGWAGAEEEEDEDELTSGCCCACAQIENAMRNGTLRMPECRIKTMIHGNVAGRTGVSHDL